MATAQSTATRTRHSAPVSAPSYTLFGSKGSGSAAIEIALGLTSANYRIRRASSWEPGPSLRALERINPLKQIPTLQMPDGGVLTESAAILIHLGTAHPGSKLLARNGSRRAREIRGLVYVAANCYAAIGVYDYPERWLPDASDADKARLRAGARARLHWYWEVFADQYAGDAFLVDGRLSALNVLSAIVSRWCGTRAHLREARPEFHAALGLIDAHPAVAPVLARHWPA